MRIDDFEWDEVNRKHIERHGISDFEVEEVILFDEPRYLKGRDGRYCVYGVAEAGRYLLIVLAVNKPGLARPITARDMTMRERKYYKRRLG